MHKTLEMVSKWIYKTLRHSVIVDLCRLFILLFFINLVIVKILKYLPAAAGTFLAILSQSCYFYILLD